MTNGEKFEEVFGFVPENKYCIVPDKICKYVCATEKIIRCAECPFHDYFKKEYKPCFRLRGDI